MCEIDSTLRVEIALVRSAPGFEGVDVEVDFHDGDSFALERLQLVFDTPMPCLPTGRKVPSIFANDTQLFVLIRAKPREGRDVD